MKLLIRNANKSQPVLQYLDNALTEEEFKTVQDCLIDHPMRHSNVNSAEAFGNTRGFVVSFNEKGIVDLEKHELFKCLSPYFQRHRLPNCNAWILNMVWANVPSYDKELAIERHVRTLVDLYSFFVLSVFISLEACHLLRADETPFLFFWSVVLSPNLSFSTPRNSSTISLPFASRRMTR